MLASKPATDTREPATDHTFDALHFLSADKRAVLVLRYYADHTYEEIAQTLGIPVGTVRSRLHRAEAELGKLLRDQPEPHLPASDLPIVVFLDTDDDVGIRAIMRHAEELVRHLGYDPQVDAPVG